MAADAQAALTWLTGSVGMSSPTTLTLLAITLALFVPAGIYASRVLRPLELGEATAKVLGARMQRDRFVLRSPPASSPASSAPPTSPGRLSKPRAADDLKAA